MGIAHRESIRGAMLVDVLHKIAEGKIKQNPKMLAVRNTAALGLLKFQLPVMQAVDPLQGLALVRDALDVAGALDVVEDREEAGEHLRVGNEGEF